MTLRRLKHRVAACLAVAVALTASPLVMANDDLDVTMRMIQDGEDLTGSVVREIRLPERGASPGSAAPRGNVAVPPESDRLRERGREFGQSVSERAREARDQNSDRRPPGRPDVSPPGRESIERRPDPSPNSAAPSRP